MYTFDVSNSHVLDKLIIVAFHVGDRATRSLFSLLNVVMQILQVDP